MHFPPLSTGYKRSCIVIIMKWGRLFVQMYGCPGYMLNSCLTHSWYCSSSIPNVPLSSYYDLLLNIFNIMTWWIWQDSAYDGQFQLHTLGVPREPYISPMAQQYARNCLSMANNSMLQKKWPCSRYLKVYIMVLSLLLATKYKLYYINIIQIIYPYHW